MNVILPRVILGNRGDIGSRWGLIQALYKINHLNLFVYRNQVGDVPENIGVSLNYGFFRNIIMTVKGYKKFFQSDIILWAVGLDIQDDASLFKLIYLWVLFTFYKLFNKKIYCLFQGAGPITTSRGKFIASKILNQVDKFVARDVASYKLIKTISPNTELLLAHDAIFLLDMEKEFEEAKENNSAKMNTLDGINISPKIGINIRQWFHFSSNVLPFQLQSKEYLKRSSKEMERLFTSFFQLITKLRNNNDAQIVLLSGYQKGIDLIEEDFPLLERIKQEFANDDQVIIEDYSNSVIDYFHLINKLDLVIGMRLHSTLLAMNLEIPSINISYTDKGCAIYDHLGLKENVVTIKSFMENYDLVYNRAINILNNVDGELILINASIKKARIANNKVLMSLFN